MKKLLIIIISLMFITGCTHIDKIKYDELLTSVIASSYNLNNTYRSGYKYYLPNGLDTLDIKDFNEKLQDKNYSYYLYVDVVSYYNRVVSEYETNNDAYISYKINYEDKFGYLEVNKVKSGKYFVEIMYNYAKIEVIVDESNLNKVITNSIIILSSITYNNDILANIVGDNILQFNEEEFNIFRARKDTSNFLEVESNNIYEEIEEQEVDPDLID